MVHVKTSVEESTVAVLDCGGSHVGYMLQDASRSSRKVGFFVPSVANTPTLVTHSPHVTGDLTEDGYFYDTKEVTLEAAQYTIFLHCRWSDVSCVRHDMSRAVLKDFVLSCQVCLPTRASLCPGQCAV